MSPTTISPKDFHTGIQPAAQECRGLSVIFMFFIVTLSYMSVNFTLFQQQEPSQEATCFDSSFTQVL